MEYKVEIFEDGYWNNVTATIINPIAISELLDTGLDTANIVVWNVQNNIPYQPFTKVKITLTDESQSNIYRYFIASDNVEINNFGDGGFNQQSYIHNISLIEPTKILERINVDNLTVTQSKLIGFGGDFEPVSPVITGDSEIVDNLLEVRFLLGTPMPIGSSIYFPGLFELVDSEYYSGYILLKNPTDFTYPGDSSCKIESSFGDVSFGNTLNLEKSGNFFISITLGFGSANSFGTNYTLNLTYNFSVTDIQPNTEKTITSELQRILNVTPTRRFFGSYYKLGDPSGLGSLAITKQQIENNAYYNYSFDAITGEITFKNKVQSFSDITNVGQVLYLNIRNANPSDLFWTLNVSRIENDYLQCGVFQTSSELIQGIDTQPYFVLDNAIAEKYKDVRCPEFTFTKQTLWEVLLQFGNYIHAIPRLVSGENENWNVITFDFLGLQKNTNLINEVYNISRQDIEQYTTELDSYVDNVINTESLGKSSIIEPGENIFKSITTSQGGTITNDNCEIVLDYPIYELKKVMIMINGQIADITKYCYESAEYRLLSSYNSVIPYSKAYALEYSIGGNVINQLQYKLEDPLSPAFKNYAIINILKLFNINMFATDLINIQYQVEYIPITSNRFKQRKVNYKEYNEKSSLFSNQSANMVSSVAYGENLKGDVLRLSNLEISKTFRFYNLSEIPNVGDTVGSYYITQINLQCYRDYINATIQFSKDFNRLSKYIGITSFNRMYEVSERQTVERFINYDFNCNITFDSEDVGFNDTVVTKNGKTEFISTFGKIDNKKVSAIKITTYNKNRDIIKELIFPSISFAIGNSVIFSVKFEDNYSAGVNIFSGISYIDKKFKNYIPYCNEFGDFEFLRFQVGYIPVQENMNIISQTIPDAKNITGFISYLDTNNSYSEDVNKDSTFGLLRVSKGNREIPQINVQMHFISDNEDIVIGYFLSHKNGLIADGNNDSSSGDSDISWYALPYRINKFDKTIDMTDAVKVTPVLSLNDPSYFGATTSNPLIYIPSQPNHPIPINCESIALVNEEGELIVGYNKHFDSGDVIPTLYFTFN